MRSNALGQVPFDSVTQSVKNLVRRLRRRLAIVLHKHVAAVGKTAVHAEPGHQPKLPCLIHRKDVNNQSMAMGPAHIPRPAQRPHGTDTGPAFARLGATLKANDQRQDYLRATLTRAADGSLIAAPFTKQDSAMLSLIAKADALIIRPPHAPAAQEGDVTEILPLAGGCLGI